MFYMHSRIISEPILPYNPRLYSLDGVHLYAVVSGTLRAIFDNLHWDKQWLVDIYAISTFYTLSYHHNLGTKTFFHMSVSINSSWYPIILILMMNTSFNIDFSRFIKLNSKTTRHIAGMSQLRYITFISTLIKRKLYHAQAYLLLHKIRF